MHHEERELLVAELEAERGSRSSLVNRCEVSNLGHDVLMLKCGHRSVWERWVMSAWRARIGPVR
jgi:hypothetical protein